MAASGTLVDEETGASMVDLMLAQPRGLA